MKTLIGILSITVVVLGLTGCGVFNKMSAQLKEYSFVCVKKTNVMYIQFPTGAAPAYLPDGALMTCK